MQRYRALVSSIGVSDDAKDEVIRIVGSMMQDFVDRAFGEHPAQQISGHQPRKVSLESTGYARLAFSQSEQMNEAETGFQGSRTRQGSIADGEN